MYKEKEVVEMAHKTVLLTGATGQIGSALAPLLQASGYRICYLIRPSIEKTAQMRLAEVLSNLRDGLDIAISGDVTLPYGGISDEDLLKWRWDIDMIIHCAAGISFLEAEAENTRTVNIEGTRNMLQLAKGIGCEDFHYVSTAYIAGSARIFSEEDLDVGQLYLNPYAASKVEAEKLVRAWQGGKFTIHRLSTVIGDSYDGKVMTFHSYYGFFASFWRLLKTWEEKWKTNKESCLANGVKFHETGDLELPLFIDCSPTAVLNLTTVDWVALTMAKLVSIPSDNQTYHVVNPNPPRVRWVIEVSLKLMGISGIRYDEESQDLSPLLKRIQIGVTRGTNMYRPYVRDGTVFLDSNLRKALGEEYSPPPVINEKILALMLTFAKSRNFGLR